LDGVYAWLRQQHTTSPVKHTIEETPQKCGETTLPGKTLEEVAIYLPLVKTFLEVFSKGW
jgi:hypothetical protein